MGLRNFSNRTFESMGLFPKGDGSDEPTPDEINSRHAELSNLNRHNAGILGRVAMEGGSGHVSPQENRRNMMEASRLTENDIMAMPPHVEDLQDPEHHQA